MNELHHWVVIMPKWHVLAFEIVGHRVINIGPMIPDCLKVRYQFRVGISTSSWSLVDPFQPRLLGQGVMLALNKFVSLINTGLSGYAP